MLDAHARLTKHLTEFTPDEITTALTTLTTSTPDTADPVPAPPRQWRIHTITVTDLWGITGTRTLTLPTAALTALTGANGTGKSSLASNAIRAALTGTTGATRPDTPGTLTLHFRLDHTDYRIRRTWGRTGTPTHASLTRTNDTNDTIATGVTRTNTALTNLLGPIQLAEASWLTAQGDLARFTTLEPRTRFTLLANLFHLDTYATWHTTARTHKHAAEHESAHAAGKLAALTTQLDTPIRSPEFADLDDTTLTHELTTLETQLATHDHHIATLTAAQATLAQAATIARAARLESERHATELEHAATELDTATHAHAEAQQQRAQLAPRITTLTNKLTHLTTQLAQTRTDHTAATTARTALTLNSGVCATCQQPLTPDTATARATELDTELARLTTRGQQLRTDHDRLTHELTQAQATLAELDATITATATRMRDGNTTATQLRANAATIRANATQANHDARTAAEATYQQTIHTTSSTATPDRHTLTARINQLRTEQQRRAIRTEQHTAAKTAHATATAAKETADRTAALWDAIETACARSGIPATLLTDALNALTTQIEEWLTTAGSTLTTEATITGDKIQLLARINNGPTLPYQALSGGQQFLLDLATRLALTDLLAGQTNLTPNQFILDEGWGVLDPTNRAIALNLLQQRASLGTSILTVTHSPEVAAAANHHAHLTDTSLTLTPTNNNPIGDQS